MIKLIKMKSLTNYLFIAFLIFFLTNCNSKKTEENKIPIVENKITQSFSCKDSNEVDQEIYLDLKSPDGQINSSFYNSDKNLNGFFLGESLSNVLKKISGKKYKILKQRTPDKYLSSEISDSIKKIKGVLLEDYSFSNINNISVLLLFKNETLIEIKLSDQSNNELETYLKTANLNIPFIYKEADYNISKVKANLYNCESNLVHKFSYPNNLGIIYLEHKINGSWINIINNNEVNEVPRFSNDFDKIYRFPNKTFIFSPIYSGRPSYNPFDVSIYSFWDKYSDNSLIYFNCKIEYFGSIGENENKQGIIINERNVKYLSYEIRMTYETYKGDSLDGYPSNSGIQEFLFDMAYRYENSSKEEKEKINKQNKINDF